MLIFQPFQVIGWFGRWLLANMLWVLTEFNIQWVGSSAVPNGEGEIYVKYFAKKFPQKIIGHMYLCKFRYITQFSFSDFLIDEPSQSPTLEGFSNVKERLEKVSQVYITKLLSLK